MVLLILPLSWLKCMIFVVSTPCGCSSLVVMGRGVFVHRLVYLWAGLDSNPSVGVFRCIEMDRYGASLLSFALRSSFFVVLMTDSTLPFACGCPGLLVWCSKSYSLMNWLNFSEANCGLLSLTTRSGIPCLMKWLFNFLMGVAAFSLSSWRNNWQWPSSLCRHMWKCLFQLSPKVFLLTRGTSAFLSVGQSRTVNRSHTGQWILSAHRSFQARRCDSLTLLIGIPRSVPMWELCISLFMSAL